MTHSTAEQSDGVSRRARRKNRRRQEVLKVAAQMFARLGYERTTLDMIANELGLSKPALYYYVKSKEDVLAQILEDIVQGITERVQADISPTMPPDERLRQLIIAHVARICEYPEGRAFILYESQLLSQCTPEILAMRDRYQRLVESIIAEGVEKGIFHVANVKLAAFALLGTLNWIPRWYSPEGPLSPEEIGEYYARILVGGLIAPLAMPSPPQTDSSLSRRGSGIWE
jgi:AcrR family transcriptional regulator